MCVLPIICCPKATLNIFKVFLSFFPQLKDKFDIDMLFFFFLILPLHRYINLANGTIRTIIDRTFLNSDTCYSHIPNIKWLSRLLYPQLLVENHASSSIFILWSVWQLVDHAMYITLYPVLAFYMFCFIS